MLDQITLTGAILFHIFQQFRNDIQLMISRKNHSFFHKISFLIVLLLQMHIFLKDFHQAVLAEYPFPKVCSIISIWIYRISFATYFSGAITSLIKWQKISVCALKSCSHINIGKVYSEMYQHSFLKGKNRILTGTIKLILINRICCILSCKLTFQFHRYHRNAVYKKNNINAVFIMYRVMKLSGTMKNIRIILNLCSLIQSGLRLPENRIKLDASIRKSMPHHIQKVGGFHFSFEAFNYLIFGILRINFHISFPFLRLAYLDKFHKCFLIKSRFTIKFLRITFDKSDNLRYLLQIVSLLHQNLT